MKKRFTEEQIIGFLREAETGLPIKDLRLIADYKGDQISTDDAAWAVSQAGIFVQAITGWMK